MRLLPDDGSQPVPNDVRMRYYNANLAWWALADTARQLHASDPPAAAEFAKRLAVTCTTAWLWDEARLANHLVHLTTVTGEPTR